MVCVGGSRCVFAVPRDNGTAIAVQYDDDNLLTHIGDLALNRNGATGFLEGSSLGTVTDSWSYNSFGESAGYSALVGPTPVYTVQYTRDGLGRITTKVETINAQTTTYGYAYDPSGQLIEVKEDGVTVASYSYDANGNRLSATIGGGTVTGTYDAQDRLLQYGNTTYSYTQDGRLQSKTEGTATTSYQYDELGNLTRVILPDGKQIDYLIDGLNRRLGKKVDGALVQGVFHHHRAAISGAARAINAAGANHRVGVGRCKGHRPDEGRHHRRGQKQPADAFPANWRHRRAADMVSA